MLSTASPLIVGPRQSLPPLIMTYRQLRQVLAPVVGDYKWADDTVWDLWIQGAPMPANPGESLFAGAAIKRLIVPSQLSAWLEDVLNRQGRPLDDAAKLYAQWAAGYH